MAGENVMTLVRTGMDVKTTDGQTLGKVINVWYGEDPTSSSMRCDEEVCSRLEVQLPQRGGTRYIPYSAIDEVSGNTVTLNIDLATVNEHPWHRVPSWLPSEGSPETLDPLVQRRAGLGGPL